MLEKVVGTNTKSPVETFEFSNSGELPKWLEDAIKDKKTPYFEITNDEGKYYLIYVLELHRPLSYEEVKPSLIEQIKNERIKEEQNKIKENLISELRKDSHIEITNEDKVIGLKVEIP